jgi:hypothetical protein
MSPSTNYEFLFDPFGLPEIEAGRVERLVNFKID